MPPPQVAERYRRFARDEAPGRSELYAEWAAGVAADRAMPRSSRRIPETHRQPPLVFAVTRMLGAPERPYRAVGGVGARPTPTRSSRSASARSLQTNEPLRCAALLPALSGIDGPIALLEVGASAGLCLYPDRYSYRYRRRTRPRPAGGHVDRRAPLRRVAAIRRCGCPRSCGVPGSTSLRSTPRTPPTGDFLTSLVWPGEDGSRGADRGGARHRGGRSAAADRG